MNKITAERLYEILTSIQVYTELNIIEPDENGYVSIDVTGFMMILEDINLDVELFNKYQQKE